MRKMRTMAEILDLVDLDELRHQVGEKYREVVTDHPAGANRHDGASGAIPPLEIRPDNQRSSP